MADSAHGLHRLTVQAVEKLEAEGHELCMVPQSIYEFWSVATRSVQANGLAKPPSYPERLIPKFCRLFRLLTDDSLIFDAWLGLVVKHQITGVHTFDARLAAAMQVHTCSHLLTYDPDDFRQFPHISILEPRSVVKP
jgi:predicted nucleic acid-binding protein